MSYFAALKPAWVGVVGARNAIESQPKQEEVGVSSGSKEGGMPAGSNSAPMHSNFDICIFMLLSLGCSLHIK